jgi:OmpA-OmpF porin, OOP family
MTNRTEVVKKTMNGVGVAALSLGIVALTVGCSSKHYVRSQTAPIVAQTNQLEQRTADDHRNIRDTDARAQQGIAGAKGAAETADQHAMAAGQSADAAGVNAKDAYNRVDTLNGVVAGLDKYKPLSDVSVTFGFDKAMLTAADKKELDAVASSLQTTRHYLLEVTGGTDAVGDAAYNYALSQRRADAVVTYLAAKYNIPPHKFYMVGIGKDKEVATNKTAAGRAKNRRVQVRVLSNMEEEGAPEKGANGN